MDFAAPDNGTGSLPAAPAEPTTPWWQQLGDHALNNTDKLLLAVGGIVVILGGFAIWRWFRTGAAHTRVGVLAVVLATGFSAEGMWEVATESLHLNWWKALVLFAMFEIVMVHQAMLAKHKMRKRDKGETTGTNPRPHMNFLWAAAAASGLVASLNSTNVTETAVRFLAPLVAAGIYWMDLVADGMPERDPESITWRFSPRRILVALGLAQAGETTLTEADRERRVAKLTANLAGRLDGWQWLRPWYSWRLRRRGRDATDLMVAEAQENVRRARLVADPKLMSEAERRADAETEAALARGEAERLRTELATLASGGENLRAEIANLAARLDTAAANAAEKAAENERFAAKLDEVLTENAALRTRCEALAAVTEKAAAKPGAKGSANAAAKPSANRAESGAANHGEKPTAKAAANLAANAAATLGGLGPAALDSMEKLARAYLRKPGATNTELAATAGVSAGTANRYLPALRTAAANPVETGPVLTTPIPEPRPAITAGTNGHAYSASQTGEN